MSEEHQEGADPRLEAEGELSLARIAFDGADLAHAATHLAGAMVADPTMPEVHELLARLVEHPDGGVELFPMEQPVFLGTVVCRAHALASQGDYRAALSLLVNAQNHEPGGMWAVAAWLFDDRPSAQLSPEDVATALGRLLGVVPNPASPEQRRPFEGYAALTLTVVSAHPDSAQLLWMASVFLRRLGRTAEAIDLASRSHRLEPSFSAAMALGSAYRVAERWAEAEEAMLTALHYDPDNRAMQTDIAELLAQLGRLDEAIAWTRHALSGEPDHPNAFPTDCALRFQRDGEITPLIELADFLRATPDNSHADHMLTQSAWRRHWSGPLTIPTEAVVNVMMQFVKQEQASDEAQLVLSAVEPPSALLAVRRGMPAVDIEISEIPAPDPRRTIPEVFAAAAVAEVGTSVWHYEGAYAAPAVAPPSESTLRAVADFGLHRWQHPLAAYDAAVRLSGIPLAELRGVLVHPPEPEPGQDAAVWPMWLRSIQCWACLGIAHHRADEPWPGSTRRRTLVDLVYGPEDWVTEAAAFALVTTAWVHPDTRVDVEQLVGWRFLAAVEAAQQRPVTILRSLADLVVVTPHSAPGSADEVRGLAREVIAEDEEDDASDRDPDD